MDLSARWVWAPDPGVFLNLFLKCAEVRTSVRKVCFEHKVCLDNSYIKAKTNSHWKLFLRGNKCSLSQALFT